MVKGCFNFHGIGTLTRSFQRAFGMEKQARISLLESMISEMASLPYMRNTEFSNSNLHCLKIMGTQGEMLDAVGILIEKDAVTITPEKEGKKPYVIALNGYQNANLEDNPLNRFVPTHREMLHRASREIVKILTHELHSRDLRVENLKIVANAFFPTRNKLDTSFRKAGRCMTELNTSQTCSDSDWKSPSTVKNGPFKRLTVTYFSKLIPV